MNNTWYLVHNLILPALCFDDEENLVIPRIDCNLDRFIKIVGCRRLSRLYWRPFAFSFWLIGRQVSDMIYANMCSFDNPIQVSTILKLMKNYESWGLPLFLTISNIIHLSNPLPFVDFPSPSSAPIFNKPIAISKRLERREKQAKGKEKEGERRLSSTNFYDCFSLCCCIIMYSSN